MRTRAEISDMIIELQQLRSYSYDGLKRSAAVENEDGIAEHARAARDCYLQIKALEWVMEVQGVGL